MGKGVAVMITAFNEARVIGEILSQIPEEYAVYVVDDGSYDGTGDVAREYGARVIRLPFNVGQGAAAIVGYKVLAREGYDWLVKMDGDGQHDPKEISRFVERLRESGVDTVVGSRVLGSNYQGAPLARRLFLRPLNLLLGRLTGYHFTDSMCGFRAFRGDTLKRLIPVFDRMIEPEYMASELWIRLSAAGVSVSEVPVHLRGRKKGFSYKGLFRYGWGILVAIVKTKLDMLRS